jgi:FKBP-type peptidyl-prolyl cis-trans isomerase FklB
MRRTAPPLLLALALLCLAVPVQAQGILNSQKDKVSYSIGLTIGQDFAAKEIEVVPEIFILGLKDGLAGRKSQLTPEEMKEVMQKFSQELQAKAEAKFKKQAEANKKAGEAFLAENKKKKGVRSTDSGLQYEILAEGKGQSPKPDETVTVHYRGTLLDGTEFDSSIKRGQPAVINLGQVIKGWTEALPLMKEGAKWRLFIPADLAYGPQGMPPVIAPESTLIFEVELIAVGEPKK